MSATATPPRAQGLGEPPLGDPLGEPPRSWLRLAVRFALAALVVIGISGGATYLLAREEIHKLVEQIVTKKIHGSAKIVVPSYEGGPETLLLVGNDERRHTTTAPVLPHSNEMLLVRIDPHKPTIAMLSVPRELLVPIHKPNGETVETRINAAFQEGWLHGGGTSGGVKLMDETIKQVLGITVNKVFITNFTKFKNAIDAMGCVYMMVDTRYYHNNQTEEEQYMETNLQPGYQRVCGPHALEFVADRHDSTSLIRDARDQRFLLEVKSQYGSSLFEEREKFERILGRSVESTIQNEGEVLELLKLLIGASGKPVRQVAFHVSFDEDYDIATHQQIHEAVSSFLHGTGRIRPRALPAPHRPHGRHRSHRPAPPASVSLTPTPSFTIEQALAMGPHLPFTVEAPRGQVTASEAEPDRMRAYGILGPGGHSYPAYVISVAEGELGQYYDIEGTRWTEAPLFGSEPQKLQSGSRTYSLQYAGEQLKTIGWQEGGAAYWVENTLSYSLSPKQMLAIAEQTVPVGGLRAHSVASPIRHPSHVTSLPRPSTHTLSKTYRIGALVGFAGLGLVALLFPFALVRARRLGRLRVEVAEMMLEEERQRALITARARRQFVALPAGLVPAVVGASVRAGVGPPVPKAPAVGPPVGESPPVGPSVAESPAVGPSVAESPAAPSSDAPSPDAAPAASTSAPSTPAPPTPSAPAAPVPAAADELAAGQLPRPAGEGTEQPIVEQAADEGPRGDTPPAPGANAGSASSPAASGGPVVRPAAPAIDRPAFPARPAADVADPEDSHSS